MKQAILFFLILSFYFPFILMFNLNKIKFLFVSTNEYEISDVQENKRAKTLGLRIFAWEIFPLDKEETKLSHPIQFSAHYEQKKYILN